MDNVSNMRVVAQEASWPHASCFAHTLQLCVEDGLKVDQLYKVMAASQRVVWHFSHSILASDALKWKQLDNVKPLKLLQAVPSRWNSAFHTTERLLKLCVYVYHMICDDKVTKASERAGLDIPDSFWKVMEDLVPVLHPLAEATEILGCEDKPTGSFVHALAHGLVLGALWPCDQDSAAIRNVKTKTSEGMANRMSLNDNGTPKQLLVQHPYMVAAFLPAATCQYCHNSLAMVCTRNLKTSLLIVFPIPRWWGLLMHHWGKWSRRTRAPIQYKMSSYQYRKSHCGDKTVIRSSYLHNGISYTGKASSLYWIRVLPLPSKCSIWGLLRGRFWTWLTMAMTLPTLPDMRWKRLLRARWCKMPSCVVAYECLMIYRSGCSCQVQSGSAKLQFSLWTIIFSSRTLTNQASFTAWFKHYWQADIS